MFFPREEAVVIDGVKFEIPNHIRVDTWNSKLMICNDVFEIFKSLEDMEKEDYLETKKKLVGHLKNFEKQYAKHVKKTHPEVQDIITAAITPILDLLESNYNFHKIEELRKTGEEIPSFRFLALEDRFCDHMEIVCKVLSDHGKLQDIYDIKRMLNLLKKDEWEENVPMAYYLKPLQKSIKECRTELLHMRKLGANRCKYYIEDNQPFHDLVIKMVKNDVTAQWLMGDDLKNDQLCFLYDAIKIIHNSSLKNKLINKDKDLIDNIIPKIACFRGLIVIRDILNLKIEEEKQVKKGSILATTLKQEELAKMGNQEEVKEEIVDDENEEARALRKQKLLDEAEMKKYGRKWIWQNYISENRKDDWTNAAEDLRHINKLVIQDIQDFILIEGFSKQKQTNRKALAEDIEQLLGFKAENKDSKEELAQIKKKRDFELSLRPPMVWNFVETRIDEEEKIKLEDPLKANQEESERQESDTKNEDEPYLINHNAMPASCYKFEEAIHTNRVQKFMKDLENLTYNLKNHESQKWKTLVDLCIDIFVKNN